MVRTRGVGGRRALPVEGDVAVSLDPRLGDVKGDHRSGAGSAARARILAYHRPMQRLVVALDSVDLGKQSEAAHAGNRLRGAQPAPLRHLDVPGARCRGRFFVRRNAAWTRVVGGRLDGSVE